MFLFTVLNIHFNQFNGQLTVWKVFAVHEGKQYKQSLYQLVLLILILSLTESFGNSKSDMVKHKLCLLIVVEGSGQLIAQDYQGKSAVVIEFPFFI